MIKVQPVAHLTLEQIALELQSNELGIRTNDAKVHRSGLLLLQAKALCKMEGKPFIPWIEALGSPKKRMCRYYMEAVRTGNTLLEIMGRSGKDDFQTLPYAVECLFDYLPKGATIWECAAGKGNLVFALKYAAIRREDAGWKVKATDIKTGQDFLKYDKSLGKIIITNSPFSLKDEFLANAYSLGVPFAFLMPLGALDGKARQRLYRRHGLELVILPDRMHFETPSGKASHSWYATAWFCWRLTGSPMLFTDCGAKNKPC